VEDGNESDASITTTAGSRTRKAFLVNEGEDGVSQRLAFGECRPDEGFFVVAPNGVIEPGVDIAGVALGVYAGSGGLLLLDDLNMYDFALEWVAEDDDVVAAGGRFEEDDAVAAAVMDEDEAVAAPMEQDGKVGETTAGACNWPGAQGALTNVACENHSADS
jgi:hypothetical protein